MVYIHTDLTMFKIYLWAQKAGKFDRNFLTLFEESKNLQEGGEKSLRAHLIAIYARF